MSTLTIEILDEVVQILNKYETFLVVFPSYRRILKNKYFDDIIQLNILKQWFKDNIKLEYQSDIEELSINYNRNLRSLPEAFGTSFPALRCLYLYNNPLLRSLPPTFGTSFPNLESLDISYNPNLKSLPKAFGTSFSALIELNLSHNPNLKSLPESFCTSFETSFPTLRILYLNGNPLLKSLPKSLLQLIDFRYDTGNVTFVK